MGLGFDCASQSEIQQVLDMGLNEDQIVYSHPHKNPSSIQYAAQNNVSLMTIDSETELYKIKKLYPDARLLLRVLVDDKHSAIPQGIKFGAMQDDVEHLLSVSKELNLNVVGAWCVLYIIYLLLFYLLPMLLSPLVGERDHI